jgi:hypothetical protein
MDESDRSLPIMLSYQAVGRSVITAYHIHDLSVLLSFYCVFLVTLMLTTSLRCRKMFIGGLNWETTDRKSII